MFKIQATFWFNDTKEKGRQFWIMRNSEPKNDSEKFNIGGIYDKDGDSFTLEEVNEFLDLVQKIEMKLGYKKIIDITLFTA